jgi:hypothetical protein
MGTVDPLNSTTGKITRRKSGVSNLGYFYGIGR